MDRNFSELVTTTLEYRIRQLVPAIILIFPYLWLESDKKFHIEGITSEWLLALTYLSIALTGSFITETFAEYIEHKIHWRYWNNHPQYLRKEKDEKINLSEEWYKYLKRETNNELIADKYISSFVDRMRLRCALILPFFVNSIYFGLTFFTSQAPAKSDIATSIFCAALTLFFFFISRDDVRVLINTRKSTINGRD